MPPDDTTDVPNAYIENLYQRVLMMDSQLDSSHPLKKIEQSLPDGIGSQLPDDEGIESPRSNNIRADVSPADFEEGTDSMLYDPEVIFEDPEKLFAELQHAFEQKTADKSPTKQAINRIEENNQRWF